MVYLSFTNVFFIINIYILLNTLNVTFRKIVIYTQLYSVITTQQKHV